MSEPTSRPRGRSARFALAGALGFALVCSSAVPEVTVRAITDDKWLGQLVGGILPCLLGAWLAPKVSYRRRDALILLSMGVSAIPSALLFVKIIWRIAYLPHRDWALRADEIEAELHTSYVMPPVYQEVDVAKSPRLPSWSRDVTNG